MLFDEFYDCWKYCICFTLEMDDDKNNYFLFDCLPFGYHVELSYGEKIYNICSVCEFGIISENKYNKFWYPTILPIVCCCYISVFGVSNNCDYNNCNCNNCNNCVNNSSNKNKSLTSMENTQVKNTQVKITQSVITQQSPIETY